MREESLDLMLNHLIAFPGPSYPGRIYGMYEWSQSKNQWNISLDWIIIYRKSKIELILSKI